MCQYSAPQESRAGTPAAGRFAVDAASGDIIVSRQVRSSLILCILLLLLLLLLLIL